MEFFIIILVIGIVIKMTTADKAAAMHANIALKNLKEDCPPHKWTCISQGTSQEHMQCKLCGMIPGRTNGEQL